MKTHFHFQLLPWVCRVALLVLLTVAVAGCLAETGPEPGTDTSGTDTTDGSSSNGSSGDCSSFVFDGFSGTPTANANWDDIQANILAGSGGCTNCHTGTGAGPSDLSFDSDQYARDVTNHLTSG